MLASFEAQEVVVTYCLDQGQASSHLGVHLYGTPAWQACSACVVSDDVWLALLVGPLP